MNSNHLLAGFTTIIAELLNKIVTLNSKLAPGNRAKLDQSFLADGTIPPTPSWISALTAGAGRASAANSWITPCPQRVTASTKLARSRQLRSDDDHAVFSNASKDLGYLSMIEFRTHLMEHAATPTLIRTAQFEQPLAQIGVRAQLAELVSSW